MSESVFDMELPDIQGLIKKLDMYDKKQNETVRNALVKIGDNMADVQRRLISGAKVGELLSPYIKRSRIYTTKKGLLGVTAGYQPSAFRSVGKLNPGVVGMTYEFGRPGKSPGRSGNTMEQIRKRIPNKSAKRSGQQKAVPARVTIEKGTIQPVPHIRPAYHQTLAENIRILADAVQEAITKTGA